MKERPILFSGQMVRAILEGRKTQTRRALKRIPCDCGEWIPHEMSATTPEGWQTVGHSGRWWCECCTNEGMAVNCHYGKPGDRLWVRETWAHCYSHNETMYRADGANKIKSHSGVKWKPSIHMPRKASRITLEILNVKVERLNDISIQDILSEGMAPVKMSLCGRSKNIPEDTIQAMGDSLLKEAFVNLWESINGPGSWEANPWVWVIEFKPVSLSGIIQA